MNVKDIDFTKFYHDDTTGIDLNPLNWKNWKCPDLIDFTLDQDGNELQVDKDPSLRPPRVELSLTSEHYYEYMRCTVSPHYFMIHYCKMMTDEGLILPTVRDYQIRLMDHIHNNKKSIAMMPRQSGKTVTVAAYITHFMTFNKDKTVLLVANLLGTALEHLQHKIQPMLRELPKWMQQGAVTFSKTKVMLENGSRIEVRATTERAAAGMGINMLYMDEFALVESHLAQGFMTAVMPTISGMADAKVMITSTPRGHDHFHKIYKTDNEYIPFGPDQKDKSRHISWKDIPRGYIDEKTGERLLYTPEEFKRREISNIGEVKWNQEYECKFLGSSNTLISGDVLETLVSIDPIFTQRDGCLKIYEEPQEGNIYVMGVDVGEGKENDYTTFCNINVTRYPYTIASTFADNKMSTRVFPALLREVGYLYNEAMMVVENNGIGQRVVDDLWDDFEYDNILSWHEKKGINQDNRGIRTTPTTKKNACLSLRDLVEQSKLIVQDDMLIKELYKFVSKNNTWKADDGAGNHDDMVMATCMACLFIAHIPEFRDYIDSPGNFASDVMGNQLAGLDEDMASLFEFSNNDRDTISKYNQVIMDDGDDSWLYL